MSWHVGTVVETTPETPRGRSIIFEVPGWPGNLAGQHVDVRLTAPDGYQAVRSYSIASVDTSTRVQLAVERLHDGEVSPYLVDELREGDQVEFRGPLGGWFVWRPEHREPVQLIGGGSGIVPLLAMARAHAAAASTSRFRLLYSVRSPTDAFFARELAALVGPDLQLDWLYTREAPTGWRREPHRITRDDLAAHCIPAADRPAVFVCGPTGFVETVSGGLVALGHDPVSVKTERFGGV